MTRSPLYFIALMPPENIRIEIEAFKIEIQQKFGVSHALNLPAHLTLKIPFRMSVEQRTQLIPKIDRFSSEQRSFQIDIDGFGRFSKQVIFANIVDHEPLIDLYTELLALTSTVVNLKSHEIATKIHPHITLATRDLKRSDFPPIWEEFKDRVYTASFSAEDISLFKHNGKSWDARKQFSFST